MDQGEEAGSAQLKESPLDFALWKARKEGEDTFWPSPWGDGRPGWHIECSAMAEKLLGADFEIHSGGSDLVFPHHENEIAQTEAARGLPLARIWMHNGMVRTDAEKMSKSLGNIFQLSEAIDRFGAHAVVAFLTSGHYRQPLEFSEAALEQAAARVERLRNFLAEPPVDGEPGRIRARAARGVPRGARRRLQHAAGVGRGCSSSSPRRTGARCPAPARRSPRCCRCSGSRRCSGETPSGDPEAEALLAERERARAERDFARADEIRDQLGGARLGGPRHARGRATAKGAERSATGVEIVYGRRAGRRGPARAPARTPRLDRRRHRRGRAARGSPARPTTRASSPRSTRTRTPMRSGCSTARAR